MAAGILAAGAVAKVAAANPAATAVVAAAAGVGGWLWVRRKIRQARARRNQAWSQRWQIGKASTWRWGPGPAQPG
jgi:hypothetical protein